MSTGRGRTLIGGLACLLGLVAAAQSAPSAPAQALLNHFKPVTYNMQGATAGGQSKWAIDLPQLLNNDVLALQEVGPVPPTGWQYKGALPTWGGVNVDHYYRNFGTAARTDERHAYFLHTDTNPSSDGRVNLAIITSEEAQQAWVVANPMGGRPALGVRIRADVFFTIHAKADGGSDAGALVAEVHRQIRQTGGGIRYVIMGDFNRAPGQLELPSEAHLYTSGAATQRSGGELDYMVTDYDMTSSGEVYRGKVVKALSSDHFPVEFRFYPA